MIVYVVLPWLVAGSVLGAIYLFFIGRSVVAIGDGGSRRGFVLPLLLRVALAAAAFGFAARHGALPLVMMLFGFLGAREVALRRVRKD